MSDDGLAIGGIANSVPHTDVSQYAISQVEAQVEEVESRRTLDREPAALLELVDDVGRQVVDDEIGRALAQFETAHRVVGNDLHHDAGVVGQAVPIPFERGEHESVVLFVADEPVRPCADRKRSQGVAGIGWHDGRDPGELNRKGREWLAQCERDRVIVERAHVLQGAKRSLEWRERCGIENALERVNDIAGGQLMSVMKRDAMAQVGDIGQRVRIVEALGECRSDPKVVTMFQQRAEDEL